MFKMIVVVSIQSILFMLAQLFLKISLKQFGTFSWSWVYLKGVLSNHIFMLSGICALTGTLLWIYILKKYEFSIVYPLTSISYIFSILAAQWILHESIPLTRWIGVVIIAIGVFFLVK